MGANKDFDILGTVFDFENVDNWNEYSYFGGTILLRFSNFKGEF